MMFLLKTRCREIRRLFRRTAAAFGYSVPSLEGRRSKELLQMYALYTRRWAEEALDKGKVPVSVEERLFSAALVLGKAYRRRMGLKTVREAVRAAGIIYAGLGIAFRGYPDGRVEIRRCRFSSVYSPGVCSLVSALDRGLLAGLTGGGVLVFHQRITGGAHACRASLTGGSLCR